MAKFRIRPIIVQTPIISAYLNQKIEIYSSNVIQLPSGGVDPNNIVYWSTNADAVPIKSTRSEQGNREILTQGYKFTVRYRRDKNIQNNMLIYYRGAWFVVSGYIPDLTYNQSVVFTAYANNTGSFVTT